MNDDRSSRLRERRNQSKQKVQEAAETDETEEQPEPSKPSEKSEPEGSDEPSVKDEQVGRYLYLPETQNRRIDQVYNKLKAEYEFEYDEDLEKNRHYYPLLIQHGLDVLEGFDASDVREVLDDLDVQ